MNTRNPSLFGKSQESVEVGSEWNSLIILSAAIIWPEYFIHACTVFFMSGIH